MSDEDNDSLLGHLVGVGVHAGVLIMAAYNVGPTCGLVTVILLGLFLAVVLSFMAYNEYDYRRRVKNMEEALAKLDREFEERESEETTDSEPC